MRIYESYISTKTYAKLCSASDDKLSKPVEDFRAKVIARSFVAKEIDEHGAAIVGWLITRIAIHHGATNQPIAREAAKWFIDGQLEQHFEVLFFDLDKENQKQIATTLVSVLAKVTEGKIDKWNLAQGIAEGTIQSALTEKMPELADAADVVGRIMPYFADALSSIR